MPYSGDLIARLDRALNPRTVAVVGDKKAMGYMWLHAMKTFTGKLYSVQIDPNEIPGIEELGVVNYKSLAEVPDDRLHQRLRTDQRDAERRAEARLVEWLGPGIRDPPGPDGPGANGPA